MWARQLDALLAAATAGLPATETGEPTDNGTETADHDAGTTDHDAGTTDHDAEAGEPTDRDPTEPGIAFDGLRVERTEEGFTFGTPDGTATGLGRAQLRERARGSPYVTNWYFWEWTVRRHGEPSRAFCRRLEAADRPVSERYDALRDGLVTEWGQLRIEVTLGEAGRRRYELRHVDDADAERAALTVHDDPLDARELGKFDADGRYRPLKTAPSLAGGWLFPELDWRDAVGTVETFYPASVANWHRERTGTLDVDHWADTADRQSGIYNVIERLDAEQVDRIAATCCDDSQCLKRREWAFDADTPLAADGGTGAFPCREPCSLVVAAARKWTTLADEDERTYEFTLTPSEKEQLEALIEAVADGRVDEIREADVYEGANRYRVRYLREKRLDDDGRLCGVPTDPDDHDADDDRDADDSHADDDRDADGDHDGLGSDADGDDED